MDSAPPFIYSGSFRRPLLYMAAVAALVYGQAHLRWALLWNRVDATVLDAAVVPWTQYTGGHAAFMDRKGDVPNWVSVVHFRYVVDGRPYTGERLREVMPMFDRLGPAQSAIAGISPGMHFRAYVDPGDPENAFLLPKTGPWELMLTVLSWFLLFLLWLARHERRRRAWIVSGG